MNHAKNDCRLFHILAHYYHQKVNKQVASRVAERIKIQDLQRLGNFKEISEMLGLDWEVLSWPTK